MEGAAPGDKKDYTKDMMELTCREEKSRHCLSRLPIVNDFD
jgi:hypothetical protein